MKTIILILLILIALTDNTAALTILKPTEGEIYTVGQKLVIELQALPEDQVQGVVIQTKNFKGNILETPPYIYETIIDKPIDGQEPIGIMVHRKNMKPVILKSYIYAKLPADLEVKDILFENNMSIVYMMPGDVDNDKIKVVGIFSDGSKYPLNSYSQTKYQTVDESIAKVDSNGVVTGVYPGRTSIKVTAGNITKEIKVKVIYKLDSIKGIIVAALDKSYEIKWEKSPYEGDIVSEYKIYRSKDSDGMGKKMIGTVAPGTYTFTDTQPVAGVKYYYSVEAFSHKYNAGSDMEIWVSPRPAPTN